MWLQRVKQQQRQQQYFTRKSFQHNIFSYGAFDVCKPGKAIFTNKGYPKYELLKWDHYPLVIIL
jgi:hypothetical protein